MKKPYGFAFGALLVASVVFLSAQVGGFPSQPLFRAITINPGTRADVNTLRLNETGGGSGSIVVSASSNTPTAITRDANASQSFNLDNDSNGTVQGARFNPISGDAAATFAVFGSGRNSAFITNGPTGAQAVIRTLGAYPLIFGTGDTLAMTISASQVVDFVNTPTVAGAAIGAGPIICSTACNVTGLAIGQSAIVRKNADTSRASNATVADDPDLSFTNVPIGTYTIEAMIYVTTATVDTGGYGHAWTGAGEIGNCTGFTDAAAPHATITNMGLSGTEVNNVNFPGASATIFGLTCHGNGVRGTVGPITLGWAQATSNAAATVVKDNSWIRITRMT